MKLNRQAVVLAGVLALAGGAYYYYDQVKPNGFQCEITDTENNGSTVKTKDPVTWVVEFSCNNQWRIVSLNGIPAAQFAKGNSKDKFGQYLPMRVTDTSYVLMEANSTKSDNYSFDNGPLIIDRITGMFVGATNTTDMRSHWFEHIDSKGHCVPIHIGVKV